MRLQYNERATGVIVSFLVSQLKFIEEMLSSS